MPTDTSLRRWPETGFSTTKIPDGLDRWTADEVAECLDYDEHLPADYGCWTKLARKLHDILAEAQNPTPLGGDGSNGTAETPDGRLDPNNDDKAAHWWDRLDPVEQAAITAAFAAEMGA